MKQKTDKKRRVGAPKVPEEVVEHLVELVEDLEQSNSGADSASGKEISGGEQR